MKNSIVPIDYLVLILKPKELNEIDLKTVIYSRWLRGFDCRFGEFILINSNDIGDFLADKLPTPEEIGYNNVKEVIDVADANKKWNDEDFFV